MAKASSAMTKASGGAALALTEDSAALAELGGLNLDETGLDEMDQSDIKLPTKSLNMKGKDRAGKEIMKSQFYDTVDEAQKEEIRGVFIINHKTNVWSQYDQTEGRNKIICRSDDRVTGIMRNEDGTETERPCKGCPQSKWRAGTDDKGNPKNVLDCNLVQNVISFDLDEEKLFTIRFKKGAAKNFLAHLNKHHFNKGKAAGLKTQHIPLFIFQVTLRGELHEDGTHALPLIERGPILKPEQVAFMKEGLLGIKEHIIRIARSADETGESTEAAPDTSFNTGDFGGGEGQDFVETTGESTAA
jgi:hypothetical protein